MYLPIFLTLFILCASISSGQESEESILYYYGLEESERGLEACEPRQACAALLRRYWQASALLRLCRCGRRRRCDTPAPLTHRIELNNRAHLQFCKSVKDWPECSVMDVPLVVKTQLDRMNPYEIEEYHHKNIQLTPPKLTLSCRCRYPNYWKLKSENSTHLLYQCGSLPLCNSGDFCGNVRDDLLSLYQSCLCPKNHVCVHNGGLSHIQISELLYKGKGWRAYCQPIDDNYTYEDY